MAGKDKNDLEADFFGDSNLDWLSDDDSSGELSQETLPVAPPPPPHFDKTAKPLAEESGWANKVIPPPDGKQLASQPTLIFSSVPTLPPQAAPDLDAIKREVDGAEERDSDLSTAEVDAKTAAAAAAAAGDPESSEPAPAPTAADPPADEPAAPSAAAAEVHSDVPDAAPVDVAPAVSLTPAPVPAAPPPPAADAAPPAAEPAQTAAAPDVVAAVATAPAPAARPPQRAAPRIELPPAPATPLGPADLLAADAASMLPPSEVATVPLDEDETEAAYDQLLDDQTDGTPMVRVSPSPARVRTLQAARVHKAETPMPPTRAAAAPRVAAYEPPETREAWRAAGATLVAESATQPSGSRGALQFQAGRLFHERLDDLSGGYIAYKEARDSGLDTAELARQQADLAGRTHRFADQATLLETVARLSDGVVEVDARLQAALIRGGQLDDPAGAVEQLRLASALDPQDYTSRALLRAYLPAVGATGSEEPLEVLDQLAGMAEGGVAADWRVEQASALLAAGRLDDAAVAFQQALQHEPGHGDAFLGLERLLSADPAGLAALYMTEAGRDGQTDAGWWFAKAGRQFRLAGLDKQAQQGFESAVQHGNVFAERDQQGSFVAAEAHPELAASLAREAAALSNDGGRAFAHYRLGFVRENHLGDREGALEAYQAALAADPRSEPARDAVARLIDDEASDAVAAFWASRFEQATDAAEKRFTKLRLGEAAEAIGDLARAREDFEWVVAEATEGTAFLVAVEGLLRVYEQLEDWEAVAATHELRAKGVDDPDEKAFHLVQAASAGPRSVPDPVRARARYKRALELRPGHLASLHAMSMLLEHEGDYRALADQLRAAGEACDGNQQRASYLYRAARLYVDRLHHREAAAEVLGLAIESDPGFLPAHWLLAGVRGSGEGADPSGLYRDRADRALTPGARNWNRFAASVLSGSLEQRKTDLGAILTETPDHPGALALLEVHCLAEGDLPRLVTLYRGALEGTPTTAKARLAVRVADLMADQDRAVDAQGVLTELAGWDVLERPLRAASRVAGAIGARQLALDLLAPLNDLEDRVERARLRGLHGEPRGAIAEMMVLLAEGVDPAGIGARAAAAAERAGEADTKIRAQQAIADGSGAVALRAAYGTWTAMTLELAGRPTEALVYWRHALSARPQSPTAFDGVERGLMAAGDADGLVDLYASGRPDDTVGLADVLCRAGHDARATEVLTEALSTLPGDAPVAQQLPLLVRLELTSQADDAWQTTYEALAARRALSSDPSQIETIDRKRRWLLAEKLGDTEAAWDLYQQLHADAPDDRDVTESLARIAGARGDTALGIGYLKELADSASDAVEAARTQRRIGEVYEAAGDPASARQAYLDALDHVPDDAEALAGLKRLARGSEDWPALVAVLQREAGLSEGERLVQLRRDLAQITETHLGDPAVAMDAWRAVLDLEPTDHEALARLGELSSVTGEWGVFVEVGPRLAELLPWPDKAVVLRRVGIACQEKLQRDDAIRYFEAAVAEAPPDWVAIQRLVQLYRARADWASAVRVLQLAGVAQIDLDQQVDALVHAARIEVEARHDREAAAHVYRQVLHLQPEHEGALRFMATHLYESGAHAEALPLAEQLAEGVEVGQDLDDFDTRMELATFHFYLGEMTRSARGETKSMEHYERALQLNPTHLASLQAIGPIFTQAKEWKKAEAVYRQLLQLSGGQGDRQEVAQTYTQLGLVERELGNQEKAYKRFNKALELHPNDVGALKGMALILEDLQDWSNLLNVYNNIIYHATVPDDVMHAYMTKGRILDDHMQRQDKAAQHYQRSLDFDANQPLAYVRLAELSLRREAFDEAGEVVDRALRIDHPVIADVRPLLMVVRAATLQHAGKDEDAQVTIAGALDLDPSLSAALGDAPLTDLEAIGQLLRDRM